MPGKFEMRRQTTVQSQEGPVVVSTVSAGHGFFETAIFRQDPQTGRLDLNEIAAFSSDRSKAAREIHRSKCQEYHFQHLPFKFDQARGEYIPVYQAA